MLMRSVTMRQGVNSLSNLPVIPAYLSHPIDVSISAFEQWSLDVLILQSFKL